MTVAIVGASAISAFGHGWRGLGRALAKGAVQPTATGQLAGSHPGVLGSEVTDIPAPEDSVERNARKLMSRGALLGALAVRAALRTTATWSAPYHDLGYYLGVGASGGDMDQLTAMLHASLVPVEPGESTAPTNPERPALTLSMARFGEAGLRRCNPLYAFQLMNNFSLCHGAILEDIRGPNAALFSRGSGTVAALIEAHQALESRRCPRALAGGADSAVHPVTYAELRRFGYTDIIPGEGAALLAMQALSGRMQPELALAFVLRADFWSHETAALPMADLNRFAEGSDIDLVVLASGTASARQTLTAWVREQCPGSRLVETGTQLGEALAASPALAWVAALDLLCAGDAENALVVSAGPDDNLGAVLMTRTLPPEPQRARRRPVVRTSDETDPERIPVITGVGVVSAFGIGVDRFWGALGADQHAIEPITCFDARTFPTRVAGEIAIEDWMHLEETLGPRMRPGEERDRKLPFALAAAREAWQYAGCGPGEHDAWLVLALGLEQALLGDFAPIFVKGEHSRGRDARIDWSREPGLDLPDIRFRTPVDLAARAVRRELGLTGKTVVHVSACAAGALAIAHAASLVARGATSLVLCGGADAMINPLGLGGMSRLGAPSPRASADACRPFDRRRDGLVMGEGAAIMVVESLARMRARDGRPLARILGWGSSQDGYKATAPRPDGSAAAQAMRQALDQSGLTSADIDYVNAHGTGTRLNDPTEILAIGQALGPSAASRVPISSIKGAIGHLMAASGAIELAACLMGFVYDTVPGTAHLTELDPACAGADGMANILAKALAQRIDTALSNSFGFGGQNATLAVGRPR